MSSSGFLPRLFKKPVEMRSDNAGFTGLVPSNAVKTSQTDNKTSLPAPAPAVTPTPGRQGRRPALTLDTKFLKPLPIKENKRSAGPGCAFELPSLSSPEQRSKKPPITKSVSFEPLPRSKLEFSPSPTAHSADAVETELFGRDEHARRLTKARERAYLPSLSNSPASGGASASSPSSTTPTAQVRTATSFPSLR